MPQPAEDASPSYCGVKISHVELPEARSIKIRSIWVDESLVKLAYTIFALLVGMSWSFFRNRFALEFQRAARSVLGPQASVTSMRLVTLALILLAAGVVVAPLFLL